jgi:23S rRNA (guanosine2251-2'-O)-methyltransferase
LQRQAEAAGIRSRQLPKDQIDALFGGPHEGALAFCESRALEDWDVLRESLIAAAKTGAAPIVIVPAAFEDPRNLGACIRTAAGLGADAILLPNKGSTGLTPTAGKAAAGAESLLPLCRAQDIEKEIKSLSAAGFMVFGLDPAGSVEAHAADLKGPVVLVVGGEDRGIPPHIARCLSLRLKLPMASGLHSYNASVALALLLYEAARQRGFSDLNRQREGAKPRESS